MFIDIKTKEELKKHEKEIINLFPICFNQNISIEDWRWFYLDSPAGAAYVSLYYEENQLIGHYAAIPTFLKIKDESFIAYRSMTTMVHPNGRGKGLFTLLANRVYDRLIEDNIKMIYGFPNSNSSHGFEKHLNWTILAPDRVIDLSGNELLSDTNLINELLRQEDIRWDIDNSHQSKWRTARPNTIYSKFEGLITKTYDQKENILFLDKKGISQIDPLKNYRLLVPNDFQPKIYEAYKIFDYQFGFRFFNKALEAATIKRDLILSDIF